MFGHDSLPSKIFSYAAEPLDDAEKLVVEQMFRANRYRNGLVEIERRRREQVFAVGGSLSADIARLESELRANKEEGERIRVPIKRRNALRKKRTGLPDERARLKELATRNKEIVEELRERNLALREDAAYQELVSAIDARANAECIAFRAAHSKEIYWGTRAVMEQAVQATKRKPQVRFHRFDGQGKVAVQIQKGMSLAEATLGNDSRLRLELPQDGGDYAVAWLRVQSDAKGKPVWAKFGVVWHRPLPPGVAIKWVYLLRRKVHGTHWKYFLQFVVSRAEGFDREDAVSEGDVVGVDLGWRSLRHGLRVAYWACGENAEDRGELVLPWEDYKRWERAESLRSLRDRLFNGAVEVLAPWLNGVIVPPPAWLEEQGNWFALEAVKQAKKTDRPAYRQKEAARCMHAARAFRRLLQEWSRQRVVSPPDWLRERTQRLAAWRSTARLAGVILYWREHRFAGDDALFDVLEVWRHTDRHLLDWENSQREKAVRWRDAAFRNFAVFLAKRFRAAAVEKMSVAQLMQRCNPEDEESKRDMRIDNAQIAGVGRLREIIGETMQVIPVEAKDTTARCWRCQHLQVFDRRDVVRLCDSCGREDDQDFNAAMNLRAHASG